MSNRGVCIVCGLHHDGPHFPNNYLLSQEQRVYAVDYRTGLEVYYASAESFEPQE